MTFERIHRPLVTWRSAILMLLVGVGVAAMVYRFLYGLGATTGQDDTWAWGIWKAFLVLGLISLGAAGFASAALIYFLGGERYHGVARATALWAILCYGFCGLSLVIDIAIPWRIIHPIYMWPTTSVLFEVAWCVMLYLTVLAAEVAPAAFDRFGWEGLRKLWVKLTPWYTVAGLTFFTYLMSHHSLVWAAVAAGVYAVMAILLPHARKNPSTPALLVMFGVVLSVNHQSSLGALFLLMPDKLSHFWWSPRLPFNFLLSAVSIGCALVCVERCLSYWIWKRQSNPKMVSRLCGVTLAALWAYLGFRVIDVLAEVINVASAGTDFKAAFGGEMHSTLFVVELFAGVFLPGLMLSFAKVRHSRPLRFTAAVLVVLGGLFNRINVGFLGMTMEGNYVPTLVELAVSVGIVAAILLLYSWGVKLLPIYDREPGDPVDEPAEATAPVGSVEAVTT